MKTKVFHQMFQNNLSRYLRNACLLLLIAMLLGCTFPSSSGQNQGDLLQTQMALGVQQTQIAMQAQQGSNATSESQQATIVAQSAQATQLAVQATQMAQQAAPPTIDTAATEVSLSVQATMNAQQPAQPAQPADTQPAPPPEQPADTQPPPPPAEPSEAEFKEMMKNANILLYEDIINNPKLTRYVKKTLDGMGLRYKDDGSAKGWLKSDLLGGNWDLIIIALEFRAGVSGEYFTYINQALNQGASVIVEIWYLDAISEGEASTILAKCGVDVYSNYVGKTGTPQDIIVWPLPGATDHPILSDPNSSFSFTKVWETWSYNDLGDLVRTTGRGDAQLLLGTIATQPNDHGVLTTCMDGQLTLMTFSSHSYPYSEMYPLWENMITNGLKTRFLSK